MDPIARALKSHALGASVDAYEEQESPNQGRAPPPSHPPASSPALGGITSPDFTSPYGATPAMRRETAPTLRTVAPPPKTLPSPRPSSGLQRASMSVDNAASEQPFVMLGAGRLRVHKHAAAAASADLPDAQSFTSLASCTLGELVAHLVDCTDDALFTRTALAFLFGAVPGLIDVKMVVTALQRSVRVYATSRERVVAFVRLWVESCWYRDFWLDAAPLDALGLLDDALAELVHSKAAAGAGPVVHSLAPADDFAAMAATYPKSEVPRSSPIAPAFSAFEHATGKEVARQLTLMDHRVFSCVAFEELHAQCWLKQPHMAPNVRHLILEFSRLSMWMAYSVVREFDLRARTAVLAFLVDVGYQCLKLGNFHGAALVAAVLATPPLRRLKKTLGSLPSKSRDRIDKLRDKLSPTSNFATLRALQRAKPPPALPYVGLLLQDLVFADEANTDWVNEETRVFNLDKLGRIYGLVAPQLELRRTPFALRPLPELQYYLSRVYCPIEESALLTASLKCED